MTTRDSRPEATEFLAKFPRSSWALIAVVYTTGYLVLRRMLLTLVSAPKPLIDWLSRSASALGSWNGLGLAVCSAFGIIAFESRFKTRWVPDEPVIAITIFGSLLALFVVGSRMALAIPAARRDLPGTLRSDPFSRHIRHPLDAVFIRISVYSSALVLPPFLAVVIPGLVSLPLIILYVTAVVLCGESFELLDHTTIHKNVFTPKRDAGKPARLALRALTLWHTYAASFMMGRVPLRYRIQHVFIHHVENNGPNDPQSTLAYDRTSYLAFCRFALGAGVSACIPWDITLYFARRRRYAALRLLMVATVGYFGILGVLIWINLTAAIVLVALRASAGVGIALLNFSEHGLIDPDKPSSIYSNASTVEVSGENDHGSLGSDYHIAHHSHPTWHWSLLIDDARASESEYCDHGAIVFRNSESLVRNLLARRFDLIADDCVPSRLPHDELIAEIQRRARPARCKSQSTLIDQADRVLGRIAGRILV